MDETKTEEILQKLLNKTNDLRDKNFLKWQHNSKMI